MKKIKLSIAALTIAMSANAQDTIKTFTAPDKVTIDKLQIIEMINTLDDVLFWNSEDAAECECIKNGSYEEGWGSNYWLRVIRDELKAKLYSETFVVDCENCDEID
jgi:hypothetical protein